ncbi:hypothetical protein [Alicyclobacillus sendaiensis]|uniref:hypothetical protein n=1 Tax=Alicyclobacillus sendaiensis TaxID=192387 RepID=UPI0026F41949|nr:hypothetical protein [Alicyclobacillus sendaiensis]
MVEQVLQNLPQIIVNQHGAKSVQVGDTLFSADLWARRAIIQILEHVEMTYGDAEKTLMFLIQTLHESAQKERIHISS